MQNQDLRHWLERVEEIGELASISDADWDLEIGAISRLFREVDNAPALLFDDIADYPQGFRVLVNPILSIKRLALTMGLPLDYSPMELVQAWRNKFRDFKPIPPEFVKSGPIMENVEDERPNVLNFPTPRWNELDGGRYIGTGSALVTRDPDEGWVNLGTYRVMIHDEGSLGFFISPGKHGRIHRDKWFARGEPCKVVVLVGHHPIVPLSGSMDIPYGLSEYDVVGGILGEPLQVIEGPYTGLPIPAFAEIAVEGEAVPGDELMEGPFGEFTGYYGSSQRKEPVIRIKSILHRNDPVLTGMPVYRTLAQGNRSQKSVLIPAQIWDELERAGVPDVKGVWCNEAAVANGLIIVSIKQRYPGHARQAGVVASQCHAGAYMGRYVIVVDEDIDPSNMNRVFWALSTRSDPENDIEIIRRAWSGPLDPAIEPGRKGFNSRAIIDACKPFEWIADFPESTDLSEELRSEMMAKWGKILFDE